MEPQKKPADKGWVEKKCPPYQPKALLFRMLSWLWILPSLTSIFILVHNLPKGPGPLEVLLALRLEQWVAIGLLLVHPVLVALAVRFQRTEPFRDTVLERADSDPKNLYGN